MLLMIRSRAGEVEIWNNVINLFGQQRSQFSHQEHKGFQTVQHVTLLSQLSPSLSQLVRTGQDCFYCSLG